MVRLLTARVGLALCLLVGVTFAARAEETKGTVRSINAEKNEIVLKGILHDSTYQLDKNAKVCIDGRKAGLGDLREGDHVVIDYQKAGDKMTASEVRGLRKATETNGEVRSVASENRQLILKGVIRDATYNLDRDAKVWINGKAGQLADLREGDHVRVTYEQQGERNVATEVVLTRK